MLKVVAKNFVKENNIDEMLKLSEELVQETRKEKGCLKYELFQDEEESTIMTFIEEWENWECLEAHLNSEHFRRIVPQLNELMDKEGEMNIYNKVI